MQNVVALPCCGARGGGGGDHSVEAEEELSAIVGAALVGEVVSDAADDVVEGVAARDLRRPDQVDVHERARGHVHTAAKVSRGG